MSRTWGVQPGLLGATPPAESPPSPAPPSADKAAPPDRQPASQVTKPTADVPDQPHRQPRAAKTQTQGTGPTRRVAFRVRPEVREKVVDLARQHDASYAAILIRAIADQSETGQLVAPQTPAPTGPFTYTQARRPIEPTVQIEVRLPESDLNTIDRMVAEYGWTNRTEMLTAALDRHIGR